MQKNKKKSVKYLTPAEALARAFTVKKKVNKHDEENY